FGLIRVFIFLNRFCIYGFRVLLFISVNSGFGFRVTFGCKALITTV
ncbi:Uncharacterized protein FWK35_00028818, partial [Aphis craccivora]